MHIDRTPLNAKPEPGAQDSKDWRKEKITSMRRTAGADGGVRVPAGERAAAVPDRRLLPQRAVLDIPIARHWAI